MLFNKINAGEVLSDEEYYNKGVSLYDKGAFDESFIVFFNLAEKGHKDSIFNLSNMYYEGVGTIQNFKQSLKYCWLCVLNGNKRCLKKVDKIKSKLSENVVEEIANQIPEILEKNFIEFNNFKSAFKLGFWFAQQGSIYGFVVLIFIYVFAMHRLEKKINKKEEENE